MKFIIIIILALLVGCATSSRRLERVSLGMTKPQVIEALGSSPRGVSAQQGIEMFRYKLDDGGFMLKEYWFYFDGGRLVHYGQAGDFNSAAPETKKLIIERSGASY
jgi:hypothetical protein